MASDVSLFDNGVDDDYSIHLNPACDLLVKFPLLISVAIFKKSFT